MASVHLPLCYTSHASILNATAPQSPPRGELLFIFFFHTEEGGLGSRLQLLGALQRLGVPRVNFLVAVQRLLVAEVLPTDGALVRRLPRVDPPVLQEMISADEAFPALRALIRALSSVDPLMADRFGEVPEVLATIRTRQGPIALPRMKFLV